MITKSETKKHITYFSKSFTEISDFCDRKGYPVHWIKQGEGCFFVIVFKRKDGSKYGGRR